MIGGADGRFVGFRRMLQPFDDATLALFDPRQGENGEHADEFLRQSLPCLGIGRAFVEDRAQQMGRRQARLAPLAKLVERPVEGHGQAPAMHRCLIDRGGETARG